MARYNIVDPATAHDVPPFRTRNDLGCRQPGTDPEWWFPLRGQHGGRAKGICAACPALAECRRWALDTDQRSGVWGGLTADERAEIRRFTGWAA